MQKPLNSRQLEAAELIARGASEGEVIALCGKSRSWIQALKRREDFQAAVEAAISKAQEVIAEQTKEAITSDLEQFRNQFKEAANLLYNSSTTYLKKIQQRVELLDTEEISASRLAQSLKHGADSLVVALEVGKAALGIDELSEQIDELAKISRKGHEPTNGHQSISSRIEVN